MPGWKTLHSKTVYENPFFNVKEDRALNHNGKEITYSYVQMPHPAVTVVAANSRNQILLQKNFLYSLKESLWELPSGNTNGEDPLAAAKRKLREDASLESGDWQLLGETHLACGIASIHHFLFLARNVSELPTERSEDEDISDQHFVEKELVSDMLLRNEITDGDSVIALYKYLDLRV